VRRIRENASRRATIMRSRLTRELQATNEIISGSFPFPNNHFILFASHSMSNDFIIIIMPPLYGEHFEVARSVPLSVRLSAPWRSCLGYRHAGCLQLSYRQQPEMCGLRTRPRTDVIRHDFCKRRTAVVGGISSRRPRGILSYIFNLHGGISRDLRDLWEFAPVVAYGTPGIVV